jgi:SNF2 family DNA or RNA helicase
MLNITIFFVLQVRVMIMSLKAGNLGLNMVAACHVILLDLWWNPYAEDQAIDRAHRIGQTRTVTVSRLTVKDTVEDRILALQVIYIFCTLLPSNYALVFYYRSCI